MPEQLGRPAQGDKIRETIEERLKLARLEDGAKITVPWRASEKHLHVISVPLDLLYFNPDTHRVRAQRTLDAKRDAALERDPWGAEAQEYMRFLLSCKPSNPSQVDPDYLVLKDQLEMSGQREPGIITPDGVLVDGNTRCAALRDLGKEHISVGVLPDDTSQSDVTYVELQLQLRHDKRRDYSYINYLLAIEEEIRKGRREEDVARDFNKKLATLRKDKWVLELIYEAIERSECDDGSRLRLVDFEDHQGKLQELAGHFADEAKKDADNAERLKEMRLAALLLSFPKTSMRLVKPDFYEQYISERLPEDLRPVVQGSESVSIPGIEGVEVPGASAKAKTAQSFTDSLLRDLAVTKNPDADQSSAAEAQKRLAKRDDVFDTAADLAGRDERLRKRRIAVPDRVTDAAEHIRQCASEFAEAKAKGVLDEEAFDDALIALREGLVRLAKHAGRAFDSPGDGVEWLLESAKDL